MTLPRQNQLLAALPADEYLRLAPNLEQVSMVAGEIIYESGALQDYLVFPASGIVALLHVIESGATAEIALTGNEGIIGVQLFMGVASTSSRAVVLTGGEGYRLRAELLKKELALGGKLQSLALRYIQALLTQMAQTAVCNRHHEVHQQLCRWLLLNLDRLPSNELTMTQELIAGMLGVRREGVTEAAGELQEKAVIQYSRGRITVLDRAALEASVCECYAVVKKEYDRLLPRKPGTPS
jgi:CRP-like cAMP-binding protein